MTWSKFINMKILYIPVGACFFASVNITILRLTNPDVNLKRMHQLYIVVYCSEQGYCPFCQALKKSLVELLKINFLISQPNHICFGNSN